MYQNSKYANRRCEVCNEWIVGDYSNIIYRLDGQLKVINGHSKCIKEQNDLLLQMIEDDDVGGDIDIQALNLGDDMQSW